MDKQIDLPFNQKPSTVMHIDLNSCFASIEQQANPLLRGQPIAVAAYVSPNGCILAPSVEAKKEGVRVGMRVREGKLLCPRLIILSSDPNKYRVVHQKLKALLLEYTDFVIPKSIDEFVLNFEGCPAFKLGLKNVAQKIKDRIKLEIGDWLTVSVGIGPNRFLAKQASNLKKPDGLEEICQENFWSIYQNLILPDLHGIDKNYTARLNSVGVYTVIDFLLAPLPLLRSAFHSINSYYWYLRIRGWEVDDVDFGRKSFGNMYSLPTPLITPEELSPILHKLVEKTGHRLRAHGYKTRGVHLGLLYRDRSFWHHGTTLDEEIFDSRDIYRVAFKILSRSPYRQPVANLSVSVFDLTKNQSTQLDLFKDVVKKINLTQAVDRINERWGNFVITPGRMLGTSNLVPDRIAFGGVKDII